jgi:hypothetical protein
MSSNWHRINIDLKNCFKSSFDYHKLIPHEKHMGTWSVPSNFICDPEWLLYMESIGLPVPYFMIFYRGPNATCPVAHIDIANTDPYIVRNFGINWVYGGAGSNMVWYDLPKEKIDMLAYTGGGKVPLSAIDLTLLNEIERTAIGEEPTIVRTSIPHSIDMGNDPRWCFSARVNTLYDYDWEEVIILLKDKNLLIEHKQ